jgi:hypothetical protein
MVPGTTSVKWAATRGASFTGDIAIDTILITPGGSVPPTPAPTAAPTLPMCSVAAMSSSAFFSVSAAVPIQTCQSGAGPTTAAEGTCYTTTSGTCFTDGPGDHGNNERCTINVLRNAFLATVGTFDVEQNFDYFTIGTSTTRLQTSAVINSTTVMAGSTLNWRSDGSVTNSGFTICATAAPTMSPTRAPTAATAAPITSAPVLAPITSAPVDAGASGSSGGSDDGTSLILYIIIAVVATMLLVVGLVVWAKKDNSTASAAADTRTAAAFDNPLCKS